MAGFHFYHPIEIRYSDLDPQWHVNNVNFLVFLEQARLQYLIELGLWNGDSFLDLQIIIADTHISYKSPILLGEKIRVGVQTARISNKSMQLVYVIENPETGEIKAQAETINVGYDFHKQTTMRISDSWRKIISEHEHIDLSIQ
jgi:acyl-CoA thioester hydrolase